MIKKLLFPLVSLTALLVLGGSAPVAALPVSSVASASTNAACAGLQTLDSSQSCSQQSGDSFLGGLGSKVVNLLSMIVGIIAVIMVIIGGLKYITSGGEASAAASAKTTLIYALVGLLIVAIAQFLVHFVLNHFS